MTQPNKEETERLTVEGWEEKFETELGFWFPPNVDAFTLDGDPRSAKERIKDFIRTIHQQAYEAGRMAALEEPQNKPIPLSEKEVQKFVAENWDGAFMKGQEAGRREERQRLFEGIRRWAEVAYKEKWVSKKDWNDDDELTASIHSYADGLDLTPQGEDEV